MLDERRNQSILISGESGMIFFCACARVFVGLTYFVFKVRAKLKLQSSVYTIYLL